MSNASAVIKYDTLTIMNSGTSSKHIYHSRLLRITLVVFLVFAAWHVATHDLGILSDTGEHTQCQACRLNHVPITDLPIFTWAISLFLICLLFTLSAVQHKTQLDRYTLGARAPPLF